MQEVKKMRKNYSTFTTEVVIHIDGTEDSELNIIISRFPHVSADIFKELDNETLNNCRKVSRLWCDHLDNQKMYWVRMIQRYSTNMKSSYQQWKKVLENTRVEHVKDLSVCTQQFFKDELIRCRFQWIPLQVAADQGNLELCMYIFGKTQHPKPNGNKKWTSMNHLNHTALHLAAMKGHKGVCEFLMHNSEKKNPSNEKGMTPLHYAAERGFANVCKLIIANVDNKNPASGDGCTPLHLAAREGHLEIIRLIVETGVNKKRLWSGMTPLESLSDIRSFNFYRLLYNDKTELCEKIFQDFMINFVIYITISFFGLMISNLFCLNLIVILIIAFPLTIMVRAWLCSFNPYPYRHTQGRHRRGARTQAR